MQSVGAPICRWLKQREAMRVYSLFTPPLCPLPPSVSCTGQHDNKSSSREARPECDAADLQPTRPMVIIQKYFQRQPALHQVIASEPKGTQVPFSKNYQRLREGRVSPVLLTPHAALQHLSSCLVIPRNPTSLTENRHPLATSTHHQGISCEISASFPDN